MKKYNSFLGAFLSGDDGKSGYNAGYRKSALAELYQSQDPMKQQEALKGLARVDPEAAGGWQRDNQAAVQQHAKLLVALGKDNPVAVQAWETRVKPELVRMYGDQAAALTLEEAMPYAQQIAGGSQDKYTGAPFVVMEGNKPVYYRYGPNGVEKTGLSAPDQFQMIQGPDGYYRVPTKREGDASQVNVSPTQASGVTQPTGANPIDALLQAVPGLRVTSRGRTKAENDALPNSVPDSFHLTGQAVDLGTPTPQQRQAIKQWAAANGYEVIENYKDGHLHVEPASRGGAATQLQGKPDAPKDPKTAVVYDADGNASVVDVSKPGPIAGAVRPGSQLSAKDKQKLETMKRKEFNLVNSNAAKINETVRIIDELLGSGALGGVTGMGAVGSKIPGTKWADAAAKLETLRAKSAFGALSEMRANSPTGGALGSVTERELSLLQNAETQLSQAQSPEAFAKALKEYKRILLESQKRMVEGVQGFYANESQAPSAPSGEPQRIRIKL